MLPSIAIEQCPYGLAASIVCAYVGLVYGVDGLRSCAVFGDETRGHIVIPMTRSLFESGGPVTARDVRFEGP